jgi:hypothetical protein
MFLLFAALVLAVSCSRVQESAPKPAPPPLEYLGKWGEPGNEPGKLLEPVAIATDEVGNVYIADHGSRYVTKFDSEGHPLLSFQITGRPTGIAVDLGGAMYVTSEDPASLQIFFPEGDFYRQLRGTPRHRFQKLSSVAVDEYGNFFVVDSGADRIDKFNPRGRWVISWGKQGKDSGEFDDPACLAIGLDGYLYVLDKGNLRIMKFSRDGEFFGVWGIQNGAAVSVGPGTGFALSGQNVFLAHPDGHVIQVWTLDGQFRFSDALPGPISADAPMARLAVAASARNELFVLDSAARVLRYRINP